MKKALLSIAVIFSVLAVTPFYTTAAEQEQNEGASKLAMSELLIGTGTRATAMGGMAVAITGDLSSLYWNPAGLSQIRSLEFEFIHNTWIADISRETILFGFPVIKDGILAAGINYLGLGTIEQTGINADGTIRILGEELSLYAFGTSVGYGMYIAPSIAVGATAKFNMQDLGTEQYMTFAGDIGAQYQVRSNLSVGLTLRNLGMGVGGFNIPMELAAGGAYRININPKNSILLGVDGEIPVEASSQTLIHIGSEYNFDNMISARLGYQVSDINEMGGMAGFSAGFGVYIGVWKIGYTFAPQGDLGTSHRIAVGLDAAAIARSEKQTTVKKKKAEKKRKKRQPTYRPKMGFKMKHSALSGTAGVTSAISQEEAMMRSLLSSSLQVDTRVRNINKDGKKERSIVFKISRSSGARITKWLLLIKSSKDSLIRKLSGEDLPKSISWDGKSKKGRVITGKSVKYELTLTDVNGNEETVDGRIILSGRQSKINLKNGKQDMINEDLGPILFEKNRAEVTPDAAETIREAAKLIRRYPGAKIYIQGYTDSVDEAKDSFVLSKARAEAVARYLTAYHKVPMNKILVRGRGSKSPVASNANPNERLKNRRVIITIKGSK